VLILALHIIVYVTATLPPFGDPCLVGQVFPLPPLFHLLTFICVHLRYMQ
jgi:hypothetical protein